MSLVSGKMPKEGSCAGAPLLFFRSTEVIMKNKLQEFLNIKDQFNFHKIPTELAHPHTTSLSALAKNSPTEGVELLKQVDLTALEVVRKQLDQVVLIKKLIDACLRSEGRIFLIGCGATGRLAIVLERIWRQLNSSSLDRQNKVLSFMAGGDLAFIKSLEGFEDRPDYGSRQLADLGFSERDMAIGMTEGGETPFVLGALKKAAEISDRQHLFLCCNPLDVLSKSFARSKEIIENPKVEAMSLETGPMALSGSTRMQAATVIMLVVGLALTELSEAAHDVDSTYSLIHRTFEAVSPADLACFIEQEANHYQAGGHLNYHCPSELGLAVLTDTTERSPTFSLRPFENFLDPNYESSLSYLTIDSAKHVSSAWEQLLLRAPRTLEWSELQQVAGWQRLQGHDISSIGEQKRRNTLGQKYEPFKIHTDQGKLFFQFKDQKAGLAPWSTRPLVNQILTKLIINIHSTLIMGRMGRYEGNVMTYVRPSNFKLVDRAVRYILLILDDHAIQLPYEVIATKVFERMDSSNEEQSIVALVANEIIAQKTRAS